MISRVEWNSLSQQQPPQDAQVDTLATKPRIPRLKQRFLYLFILLSP